MITRAGFIKRMAFVALASGMLGTELVGRMAVAPGPLPREGWTRLIAGEWARLERSDGNMHKTIWIQSQIDTNARIKAGDHRSLAVEFENEDEVEAEFKASLRWGNAETIQTGPIGILM